MNTTLIQVMILRRTDRQLRFIESIWLTAGGLQYFLKNSLKWFLDNLTVSVDVMKISAIEIERLAAKMIYV